MFQNSQCVMSIFEPFWSTGSGSCISNAKLCVPGGTCDHSSFGDTAFAPAAMVYLSGITPPSSHAVVVMINGGVAGPRPPRPCPAPPAGGCWADEVEIAATARTNTVINFFIASLLTGRDPNPGTMEMLPDRWSVILPGVIAAVGCAAFAIRAD